MPGCEWQAQADLGRLKLMAQRQPLSKPVIQRMSARLAAPIKKRPLKLGRPGRADRLAASLATKAASRTVIVTFRPDLVS